MPSGDSTQSHYKDRIRAILNSRKFEDLIGLVEDDWMECKGSPYDLANESQIHELIKDVAALANADGGLILIGVRTKKTDESPSDTIAGFSYFSSGLVNVKQYHDLIQERTYPPILDVEIEWLPNGDGEKGLVVLRVPAATTGRPVLSRKVNVDGTKVASTIFGYFERRRDSAEHYRIETLHALLRDGVRFSELRERLDLLTDATNRLAERLTDSSSTSPQEKAVAEPVAPFVPGERHATGKGRDWDPEFSIGLRALTVFQALGLESAPAVLFAGAPLSATTIPSLTVSTGQVVEYLKNPPNLRRGGFDLGRYDSAPLVKGGQQRRAIIPSYKAVELSRNGTFIFAAVGDDDFLCWNTNPATGRGLIVNSIVIAEVSLLFCAMYRNILSFMKPPVREVHYSLKIQNLVVNGQPPRIHTGRMRQWMSGSELPAAEFGNADFSFSAAADEPSGRTAFRFLKELYLWFGVEEDLIPYTQDGSVDLADIEERR